jgi:hypothetical protein
MLRNWIEAHGTPALQRAYDEGYDVKKGVGDNILEQLEDCMDLPVFESWLEDEERTSPTAESFAKRDTVQACLKLLKIPVGWSVQLSRISRVMLLDHAKITGVLVTVADDNFKVIRRVVVSFE